MMQGMPQQGMPPGMGQPPGEQSFVQFNPLPPGPQAVKIMRSATKCPLPKEAETLNGLMSQVLQSPEPEKHATPLAEGIRTVMLVDSSCAKQLKTRTAAIFAEDEELKAVHEEIGVLKNEIEGIQKIIGEKIGKFQTLLQKRWETAVKKAGLNPDKRFYRIDEEKGLVLQCDLECTTCPSAVAVRKARQNLAESLMLGKVLDKKEESPGEGDSSSVSKDSPEEPKNPDDQPTESKDVSETNDQK